MEDEDNILRRALGVDEFPKNFDPTKQPMTGITVFYFKVFNCFTGVKFNAIIKICKCYYPKKIKIAI